MTVLVAVEVGFTKGLEGTFVEDPSWRRRLWSETNAAVDDCIFQESLCLTCIQL